MLKLADNPPRLSPLQQSIARLAGRWWVAHTRPRCEKALAWDLVKRGIGYYLPLTERVRLSGGRKRHVLMPLFPSYVFLCGREEDRYAAMTTDRVVQTIDVPDQARLVAELSAIETALAGRAELDLYPFAALGQACRVTAGPFQGLHGVVVQRGRSARLVLQVTILGQAACLEIDADLLEAAE